MHTPSVAYLPEEMGVFEVPGRGWREGASRGEASLEDGTHYITRIYYTPYEHTTHNLGPAQMQISEMSCVHSVELLLALPVALTASRGRLRRTRFALIEPCPAADR